MTLKTISRIKLQKYLPVVKLVISFDNSSPDTNTLQVFLEYSIPALNVKDLLEFTI